MIPLVASVTELDLVRAMVAEVATSIEEERGRPVPHKVGTMIELPRAAVTAHEIAKSAEFFSFGTNDLTQMTWGFSRDDVESSFFSRYLDAGIFQVSPFESLDVDGVGRLVRHATRIGRKANPDLHLGVCGEHGGDPASIHFFDEVGLDYVSCSPFRVPGRPARGGPLRAAVEPVSSRLRRDPEASLRSSLSSRPQAPSPGLDALARPRSSVASLARPGDPTCRVRPSRVTGRPNGQPSRIGPSTPGSMKCSWPKNAANTSGGIDRKPSMSVAWERCASREARLRSRYAEHVDPPGDLVLGAAERVAVVHRLLGVEVADVQTRRPALPPEAATISVRFIVDSRSRGRRAASSAARSYDVVDLARGRGGRSRRASRSRPGRRLAPRRATSASRPAASSRSARCRESSWSFWSQPDMPESAYPSQAIRASPIAAADASASRRR